MAEVQPVDDAKAEKVEPEIESGESPEKSAGVHIAYVNGPRIKRKKTIPNFMKIAKAMKIVHHNFSHPSKKRMYMYILSTHIHRIHIHNGHEEDTRCSTGCCSSVGCNSCCDASLQ